jgi:hypothetical protein
MEVCIRLVIKEMLSSQRRRRNADHWWEES